MENLTIQQLQNYLSVKYNGKVSSTGLFMKLVEETGETAEVLNQLDGRKKKEDSASLEKELADIIHYTVAIAAINDLDLTQAIIEKDTEASIRYDQNPNLKDYIIASKSTS